jgi:hypothetical protein
MNRMAKETKPKEYHHMPANFPNLKSWECLQVKTALFSSLPNFPNDVKQRKQSTQENQPASMENLALVQCPGRQQPTLGHPSHLHTPKNPLLSECCIFFFSVPGPCSRRQAYQVLWGQEVYPPPLV